MTAVEIQDLDSSVDQDVPSTGNSIISALARKPVAVICCIYLAALVIIAIIAPILLPDVGHQFSGNLSEASLGPSTAHLLGTDSLGRDVLDRLLVGTRVTLVGVAYALIVVVLLGVPIGLIAGYFGGWVDRVVGVLVDLAFAVPAIIVVIIVVTIYPGNTLVAMCAFGVVTAPALIRVVRGSTLAIREELHVAAARSAGLSSGYILTRHVLPRIYGPIVVRTTYLAAVILLAQTGLAFLGLIGSPPAPSWGGMVQNGISVIDSDPWLIVPPGVIIALTVFVFSLLGDAVRDAGIERWSSSSGSGRFSNHFAGRTPQRSRPRQQPGERSVPMAMESEKLLSLEHLTVSFPSPSGPLSVVSDVSVDVAAGEIVGIVGESGGGKTATARAILGLLPQGAIAEGQILFQGRDLANLTERELLRVRGKEIGLISQEPVIGLDPAFRVGTQIAEVVRRHCGLSRKQSTERALELLESVRLPDPRTVAQRYPHELSGGMAQRVAIARALAGQPRMLVADEPTTALDLTVQAEVLDLLRDLRDETGMAILLVTHDWGVVADICDRVIVMYAGEVVEEAPVLPMLREPRHPYTSALLAANPNQAVPTRMLPTIPGRMPQPGARSAGCNFASRCRFVQPECREASIPLNCAGFDHVARCILLDRVATVSGADPK